MNDNIRDANAAIAEAGNQLFSAEQKLLHAVQTLEDKKGKGRLKKIHRKIEASRDKIWEAVIELGVYFGDTEASQ